jgi:hypothetical protein
MHGRGLAIAGLIVGIFSTVMLQGLMVAIAIPAFQKYVERARAAEHAAVENTPVRSKNGQVEVMPPGQWTSMDNLNPEASIQLGNTALEEYFVILSDSKADYTGTLTEYGELTSDTILKGLQNSSKSNPSPVNVGGLNALQYEIGGTLPNHTNVVYLHTVIEGGAWFHQILCWTIPSRKDAAFPVFQKTIAGFRETGTTVPPIAQAEAAEASVAADKTQSITSSDGEVKLEVPGNWAPRNDLVEGATIQLGDAKTNTFLVLQSYKKLDIHNKFEKFADQSSMTIIGNLKDGKRSALGSQKIGSLKSVQYRLDGAVDQLNLVYYVMYVEGKSFYHELLLWTVSSNQASALEVFHQLMNTFVETAAPVVK